MTEDNQGDARRLDRSPTKDERTPALRKSTRGRISMIWGVPIMALLLGASLIFQTYQDKGSMIEIHFPFAGGLKAEATSIKYLEVEVGRVIEVRLNDSLDGVVVIAELDKGAESFLREGTVFWLVRPQITLSGISAIETLLSGQYIEIVPSKTGKRKTEFVGQLNPPVGARYPDGKTVILETSQLGSIAQGMP
ncbi:MAG: MCE family protein, partial [Rhodopirellula sp.]|nr:MCE family protein [Rhodopirellula sp.]